MHRSWRLASRALDPGPRPLIARVQIEQLGEVKILWHAFEFKTLLEVLEDARDPGNLVTQFKLLHSVGTPV